MPMILGMRSLNIVTFNFNDSNEKNFQLRSFMTRTVKFNYSSDRRYIAEMWKCSHCPNIDNQSHIMYCTAYKQPREGKDLTKDLDLVHYYKQALQMRDDDQS